ncbi:MAG: glycosyltransferase, partial [Candidatus Binatia bacterium]
EYLIRAVPEIIKHHDNIRVLIVGDGPLRPELEALVHSLGLDKPVMFLGWRNDSTGIINALDLFVLASIHEGMPTAVLEAVFLGIPVVATATGGIRELTTDRWNGFLVKPRSESRLAEKCLFVIRNPSFADGVVRNARCQIQRYDVCETTALLLNLYEEVLDRVRRAE